MLNVAKTNDLPPEEVKAGLEAGRFLLVDVREPDEFAGERIRGAVNVPLSTFSPSVLPAAQGRVLVLQCAGGKRSAMALDRCRQAGHALDSHLAGGIAAWKAAGLPTIKGDGDGGDGRAPL